MIPEIGSKWWGGQTKTFYVKALVELEGKTWIYYGEHNSDKEYSCYLESFLQRFTEMPT